MSDEELRDFFNLDDENDDEAPFDDAGFFDDTPEFPEDDMGPGIDPDEFETVAGDEDEGISRTFLIIAGLITFGVIAIIILIVLFALSGGDDLTDNQKTATGIAQYNATQVEASNRTVTALAVIDSATGTAAANAELTATAEFIGQQTQQAIDAEQTATAEELQAATRTMEAGQTATAEMQLATSAAATATQVALDSVVVIQLRTEDDQILGDVDVRLYLDDGDNVFNPEDRLIGETGSDSEGAGGSSLAYGEVGEGSLELGQTAEWTFPGSAGDVISISAEAVNEMQMDTFLELFGPDDSRLAGDDDSGDISNALIESFELPVDGMYRIEVSSIAGQGDYALRLNLTIDIPGDETGDTTGDTTGDETGDETGDTGTDADSSDADAGTDGSTGYRPNTGGEDLGDGIVLVARQGGTATPTPLPAGDTLVEALRSSLEGVVDFGSLEPGTYWLELDYNSLPADLQALLPADEPLILQIVVPEEGPVGEIEFVLQISTPTPGPTETNTPIVTPTSVASATPIGTPGDIVTLTPTTETVVVVVTPSALPDSGFFSDISDDASDLDGTSGLTVLAIAAAGLVAVIIVARKLRTSD